MENETNSTNSSNNKKIFIIAWVLALVFYFIDYATRSAPSLMLNQLAELYTVNNESIIFIVSSYYITYSICALVAGICLDKFGAKYSMFAGSFILGIGCILFILSSETAGLTGRLLQGAGSAFAFPGAVYLIAKGFDAKYLATAIGFTQCIGMLGGAAGQFLVAPMLANGLSYIDFWIISGVLCIIPAILMLWIIPKPNEELQLEDKKISFIEPFKIVFSNKDSWLSGIISGLIFAPTTIFFMTWAVKFFEQDLKLSHSDSAIIASMTALGWVVGAPLMGYVTDKIGSRKPVIILGCLGMIIMLLQLIYFNELLNVKVTIFLFGVFSGVAMIPYSIIKEVNPDYVKGSATGVQNFITFGVTTAIGPLFASLYGNKLESTNSPILHFKESIWFWIIGIIIAIILTYFMTETGNKAKS